MSFPNSDAPPVGGGLDPAAIQGQQNNPPPMPASLSMRSEPPAKPGSNRSDPNAPHPDLSKPPANPGEPPRVTPIWIDPADWAAQQGELQNLRSYKADADREAEAKEQDRIRLMAENGQLKEAFELKDANHAKKLSEYATQAKTIETEWLDEKRTAAISEALTGKTFVGVDPARTAAQVRALLSQEIEAIRDDRGRPVIRDKSTLKPASEYLKERLESGDFAHFLVSTHRGGSGADGARPAAATPKTGDPNSAFAAAFLAKQADAKNARF